MNSTELAEYVGREGLLRVDHLSVTVRSLDAREVFGRLDVLVEPVQGTGQAWVAESRITWNPKES